MNFREAKPEDIPALSKVRQSVTENVLSDPRKVMREMYMLVESLDAVRGERGRRTGPARGPAFELVTQDVIAAYARGHDDLRGVLRAG